MGIEPFLLASTLEAVLVLRIFPDCRTPFEPTDAMFAQAELTRADAGGRPLYVDRGCPACHFSDQRGRVGIFEFLRVDEAMREKTVAGVSLVQLRWHAVEQGMLPLRATGRATIIEGEASLDEVFKYL